MLRSGGKGATIKSSLQPDRRYDLWIDKVTAQLHEDETNHVGVPLGVGRESVFPANALYLLCPLAVGVPLLVRSAEDEE